MKRHHAATGQFVNLTSLVDVVSMNVGILVILAVFMALLAVFSSSQQPGANRGTRTAADGTAGALPPAVATERPPALLRVPWSHPTTKQTLFLIVRNGRVQFVDMKAIYEQMLTAPQRGGNGPVPLTAPGLAVRFFPITNQVYCFEITPKSGAGETWSESKRGGSAWRSILARYPKESFVYFFWVGGDSFEVFRAARAALVDAQFEVGWKPTRKDVPLEVCNGFDGANTFQPQ